VFVVALVVAAAAAGNKNKAEIRLRGMA